MKWFRKVFCASYEQEEPQFNKATTPRVYVKGCGWGELTQFTEKGDGYIKFDSGGGQLIRNWNHFFELVVMFETKD